MREEKEKRKWGRGNSSEISSRFVGSLQFALPRLAALLDSPIKADSKIPYPTETHRTEAISFYCPRHHMHGNNCAASTLLVPKTTPFWNSKSRSLLTPSKVMPYMVYHQHFPTFTISRDYD